MKYHFHTIRFFLQEIGRQDDLQYIGHGAPFTGPHWYKTRAGFRSAWLFARLRADMKFNRL
jgi:hypothetical protein